jgi:hypothetical protein
MRGAEGFSERSHGGKGCNRFQVAVIKDSGFMICSKYVMEIDFDRLPVSRTINIYKFCILLH